MSQPAVPACKPICVTQPTESFLPQFSAELMKMLSQLVMLR